MRFKDSIDFQELTRKWHTADEKIHAVASWCDWKEDSSFYVAVKDNISVAGTLMQAGSHILEGYRPVYDATVISQLRKHGASVFCKSKMDELGMGDTGLNTGGTPILNPYDLSRITGGSSGGSAALVANGCCPLAIGTDTGDSIRQPASYTGTIGVKPTYGRISRYGVLPYANSMDTVGFFTTCIEDAAYALEILEGRDPKDMTSSAMLSGHYKRSLDSSLAGKKIGIFRSVMDTIKNPVFQKSFEDLIHHFEKKGAHLVWVDLDSKWLDLVDPVYKTIANAEACSNHACLDGLRYGLQPIENTVEESIKHARTAGFSSLVKKRFIYGAYSLYEENQKDLFEKAQRIRRQIVQEYRAALEDLDVLLALSTPDIAPEIAEMDRSGMQIESISISHLKLDNLAGTPSLSLPLGFKQGCPFGLCVRSDRFQEQKMFDIAKAIEEYTGFAGLCVEAI